MRLKHIKVAGFKSFVDQTTIPLPHNMTCIVGPNGCGKSNTIDAVRWVMGESSAKQLRGDSKTDVIFTGSSTRKPVSQASVELLFDNSEHTLVGEFAHYSEIAVRRQVTRDGQSQYYLNGTKCRRRDVTDLFLGTGLGPRSYAIIEQGMISNLIEAKPDELRLFLEEAAGISKYKERRRETELRMKRTRENLERLFDIREELGRNLAKLEKQSQDAQTYKKLQADKRRKEAELLVLRIERTQARMAAVVENVRLEEIELEGVYTQRRQAETGIEKTRIDHQNAQDTFHRCQKAFYEVGHEITKIEATQRHQQQVRERTQQEILEVETALNQLKAHQGDDNSKREEYSQQIAQDEPELEILEAKVESAAERLEVSEDTLSDWQESWQNYTLQSSGPRETAQVCQAKIQQLENGVTRLTHKQQQLKADLQQLDNDEEAQQAAQLRRSHQQAVARVAELKTNESSLQSDFQQAEVARKELQILHQTQSGQLQSLEGRLSSLQALQDKTLTHTDAALDKWCQQQEIQVHQRLAQHLQVIQPWQTAAEAVLGDLLNAYLVSNAQAHLDTMSPKHVWLLSKDFASPHVQAHSLPINSSINLPRLIDNISLKSSFSSLTQDSVTPAEPLHIQHLLPAWLQGVYLAQDLPSLQAALPKLQDLESIVTAAGIWIAHNWASMGQGSGMAGVLVRQSDIDELNEKSQTLQTEITTLKERLVAAEQATQAHQTALKQSAQDLQSTQAEEYNLASKLSAYDAKQEQIRLRQTRLQQEVEQTHQFLVDETSELNQCRAHLEEALEQMAFYEDQRLELESQKDQAMQNARFAREAYQQVQAETRRVNDRLRHAQQALDNLISSGDRLEQQTQQSKQRLTALQTQLSEVQHQSIDNDQLQTLLQQRADREAEQSQAHNQVAQYQGALREFETTRSQAEETIHSLRSSLEALRLSVQSEKIEVQHNFDALTELDMDKDKVSAEMPESATETGWKRAITKLVSDVESLGPINLAAVNEFETETERKEYLDQQYGDLEDALFTLEEAIEQIDQETRERFQITFDQVKEGMGELFPRLFGGGTATLELTEDDILNAGVAIMAQPPGKRNTSIHMLSGGEKALTAISLVFAIFRLNPAPFCMLDEVDAPLDDSNVGRYADMVKYMSEQVQFIYISHNKIAMEKADQLMGVTMQEPGVSRLVSVDIQEALVMNDA